MTEIMALIRPSKLRQTKQQLSEAGFSSHTEFRVLGRGKQSGLTYSRTRQTEGGQSAETQKAPGIPFLPKNLLLILIEDEKVSQVTGLIIKANQSGEIGDGKIFVRRLSEFIGIRSDERKSHAAV
jgi:nitrogen regulatory protein PII 2